MRNAQKATPGAPQSLTLDSARPLVWLVGLSHAANHFVMAIFPAVLLLIQREFGVGYAALGAIANAGLLCYGLGSLPAGILADRFGGQRVLAIWLFGASVSCLAIAVAGGPVSLALGLGALGLFASLHHPAGSGLLVAMRQVPTLNVARAFGLAGILGNSGLGTSPLLSSAVGAAWGWRSAFLLGVVPAAVLGFCLWRQPRIAVPKPPGVRAFGLAFADLTLPLLILFALETLMGFIFQGFTTFLPAHLAQAAGIPGLAASQVTRGGVLASAAYLLGGLGHAGAGRLMGLPRRELIFLATMAIATLCLFGIGASSGLPLVACAVILAMAHFALGTMSNTFVAWITPPHLGGTAFGIIFVLAFGVGSFASSTMGAVAEAFGLPAVFLALAGVSCAATALVFLFTLAAGGWGRRASAP